MATFLDLSTTLAPFSSIFVFILVMVMLAAFMYTMHMFQGNQLLIWAIAVIFALFVALSKTATEIIRNMAPIAVVVVIFVLIISVVGSSMMGGHGHAPASIDSMKWIVLVILVIALIVGTLASIRDKIDVPEPGEESYEKTTSVIFHPNFIGLILFFMIAVFTVALLASKSM